MWDSGKIGDYEYRYITSTGEHEQTKIGRKKNEKQFLNIVTREIAGLVNDKFMEWYEKYGIRTFNLIAINSEEALMMN